MSGQQVAHTRSSGNGLGHRRLVREGSGKVEKKANVAKSGAVANGYKGRFSSPSRDRLVFVMTNLIGRCVEITLKNGSSISGIFHTTNVDSDFSIVLKMVQTTKEGYHQKAAPDAVTNLQTMIIPSKDIVHLFAQDMTLSNNDELTNGHIDKRKEIMIDTVISNSRHAEERELERWTPDDEESEYVELEKMYDKKWGRNWNQFETNEMLFGVKSTFNEELYTTKLERGPHMRELEKYASRIAKEIEHEMTKDIHLAEERGIFLDDNYDEESRYSSVCRDIDNKFHMDGKVSATACSFGSDLPMPSHFGGAWDSHGCSPEGMKASSNALTDENYSLMDSLPSERNITSASHLKDVENSMDKLTEVYEGEDISSLHGYSAFAEDGKVQYSEDDAPASSQRNDSEDTSASDLAVPSKSSLPDECAESTQLPGNSMLSASEHVGVNSGSGAIAISRTSSLGSVASEKSTLNPNAKEFKLNPNAKSFTPSSSARPQHIPASDGPFYYPNNVATITHVPGLPLSMGVGPAAFGGPQPFMYNPQAAQMQPPQGYMQPNGPMYGQQVMVAQPRPVYYMPSYTPEMQYRGVNF